MPHYYFHVANSMGFVRDEEGRELESIEAAREEGLNDIRSILSEEVRGGRLDLRGHISIADENGDVLKTLPFGEAVELKLNVPVDSGAAPSRQLR